MRLNIFTIGRFSRIFSFANMNIKINKKFEKNCDYHSFSSIQSQSIRGIPITTNELFPLICILSCLSHDCAIRMSHMKGENSEL